MVCNSKTQSFFEGNKFKFLNVEGKLSDINWIGQEKGKLWRYNQHYFDDLNSFNASLRQKAHHELINNWIENNPIRHGVGWDPYPTSLRVVNWIKWSLHGASLSDEMEKSIAIQARWIFKRIEFHLRGNHLLANAKALIFAGLFFKGEEADSWLARSVKILTTQLEEQILNDGGHFELSPMYHSIIFEDLLDILNLINCFPNRLETTSSSIKKILAEKSIIMGEWLAAMCHPDGEISFFNDAAMSIVPEPIKLQEYAQKVIKQYPKRKLSNFVFLKDSGYIRVNLRKFSCILDVGSIGPDYLPGHAHADTLSFELSVGNRRVLINSGTSNYDCSPERLRQRGTSSHNTVVINGKDSSEVWGSFRVARRAYPLDLNIKKSIDLDTYEITCSHDGYSYYYPKTMHTRKWKIQENSISIFDYVTKTQKSSEARFHLHPDFKFELTSRNHYSLRDYSNNSVMLVDILHGNARIEKTTWHPEFGVSIPNECLIVELINGKSNVLFSTLNIN